MEKLKVAPQLNPGSTTMSTSKIDLEVEMDLAVKRNSLNLPQRFRNKTLENFVGFADKIELARETISAGKSLFLLGRCGIGKTHLAVALLYEKFVRGIKVVENETTGESEKRYPKAPCFIPSVELFLRLKTSFDSKTVSEADIIDEYSSVDCILLDDLGAEKISDWSRQVCYTLIDRRYRNMKQTIITSNLTLEELAKNIDERIASRIVEMGAVIKMEGKDYRVGK